MTRKVVLDFDVPYKLEPAREARNRYLVLWGGRGGAKSWFVARRLLVEGARRKIRVLCAREFQVSIADSVHKLLADQIHLMGLDWFYEVQQTRIIGRNGTEFGFSGLRHNAHKLKSYEGVDLCWVEEGQTVSKASWEILIPTIREEGSQIIITLNPDLETDETYTRFVANPPPNAMVIKVNWEDNPWFPKVLDEERQLLQLRDPDAYSHVWEGNPKRALEGAVYARELRELEPRILHVPYDPTKPVHTFWDLGWSDATAIWFAQVVGFEYRFLRYVEDSQRDITHFARLLQSFGYCYGDHWLPHDARAKTLASGGRSIEQQLRALQIGNVRIVPQLSITDGINAVRTMLPNAFFDRELTADGLQALRHYRYKVDAVTNQWSREPVHDQYSHAADGLRSAGVSLKRPETPGTLQRPAVDPWALERAASNSWMGV